MGCQNAKQIPSTCRTIKQSVTSVNENKIAQRILSVISQLEKVKLQAFSLSNNQAFPYMSTRSITDFDMEQETHPPGIFGQNPNSLEQFNIEENEHSAKQTIKLLCSQIQQVFYSANSLLGEVQTLLQAHKQHQIKLDSNIKDVLESFIELLCQITHDILELPVISKEELGNSKASQQIRKLLKESLHQSDHWNA